MIIPAYFTKEERDWVAAEEAEKREEMQKNRKMFFEYLNRFRTIKKARAKEKAGFIYFLQEEGGGPVKVGRTRNIKSRLSSLQCGRTENLLVRETIQTKFPVELERGIHSLLKKYRITREWYSEHVFEALRTPDVCRLLTRYKDMNTENKVPVWM